MFTQKRPTLSPVESRQNRKMTLIKSLFHNDQKVLIKRFEFDENPAKEGLIIYCGDQEVQTNHS